MSCIECRDGSGVRRLLCRTGVERCNIQSWCASRLGSRHDVRLCHRLDRRPDHEHLHLHDVMPCRHVVTASLGFVLRQRTRTQCVLHLLALPKFQTGVHRSHRKAIQVSLAEECKEHVDACQLLSGSRAAWLNRQLRRQSTGRQWSAGPRPRQVGPSIAPALSIYRPRNAFRTSTYPMMTVGIAWWSSTGVVFPQIEEHHRRQRLTDSKLTRNSYSHR